jgi:hypothetical protein
VEDRILIQELFSRWAIAYDEVQLDVIASLFAHDAKFVVTKASSRPIATATGRNAIVRTVESVLKQQGDQRRHFVSNVVISRLSSAVVEAIAYGNVTVAKGGLYLGATVIYRARMVKNKDGLWRFRDFLIGMDDYLGVPPKTTVEGQNSSN